MNRRNAIKNASLLLGYTIAAPAIVGILNGCKPEPKIPDWKPKFMKQDQVGMLQSLVDTIIPRTDTPSASDVGVVEFIDDMLAGYYGPDGKAIFTEGFSKIQSMAGETPFEKLNANDQIKIVSQLEAEAEEELKTKEDDEVFFRSAKGLILTGYMLSEKIGTEVLAYDPIPKNYDGCIPLEQNGGRSWSL